MMSALSDKTAGSAGKQTEALIHALLDGAYDRDEQVREAICTSLFDLGRKRPALVLNSCNEYLVKNAKISTGQRIIILTAMEKIVSQTLEDLEEELAVEIITRASDELTLSKDIIPEWQTAASAVIVSVGQKYCNAAMNELLKKFQPGQLPHYFVLHTLANLASANVYGMVPFIKICMGTMLPMLGMAKQDNMRWIYATALAKFSEAIVEYTANLDKAPDPGITKENFSAEIQSSWEVLFNVWLGSRETKLRSAVISALGHMSYLLSQTKLQEYLAKLLPAILSLYKKHQEPYYVTMGLYLIVDASTLGGSIILEPHLDTLLSALFSQLCVNVDYNVHTSLKNHNEILRCYSALSTVFSDKIITFLLQKLEQNQNNERSKIGVTDLFRHLINSSGSYLRGKEDIILTGLKPLLADPSNKVKKSLAGVVVAMGHHGYLELEGGQLMIDFIVRQCCLLPSDLNSPKRPQTEQDSVTNDELKVMCENVLNLLSSTAKNVDVVLWPYLFELLVIDQYTQAVGCMCKTLTSIATRKQQNNEPDFNIDFKQHADVPKSPEMLARLVVLLGHPSHGKNRGPYILSCLEALTSLILGRTSDMWSSVLPKMSLHLEDNLKSESFQQKNWEDLVLKLLSKTLDELNDETWTVDCGEALVKHITLYNSLHHEKGFLYKCIGVVARKTNRKDIVNKLIDSTYTSVNHSNALEREGCAVAMGLSAASHLDIVLAKLDAVTKLDAKRSSGFLNFFKDGSDAEEKLKATLMLSYGYVTLYSPPELILSRLEAAILRSVNPHLTNVKDRVIKQSVIRAVDLIGQAMHPDHLNTNFSFTHRNTLLLHLQNYIKAESTTHITSETRAVALNACATLVKLDPKLTHAELQDLSALLLASVLPLPLDPSAPTQEEYKELEQITANTVQALTDVMRELITKDMRVATLNIICQLLYPYMKSAHDQERLRAVRILHALLDVFYLKVNVVESGDFDSFGRLTSWVVPRCSDPNVNVRHAAFDCIEKLLLVASKYSGKDGKDEYIGSLVELKERVTKADSTVMFSAVNDLSKIINKKVPVDQLDGLFGGLLEGLTDPHPYSASGACVVVNSVLKSRGGEFHNKADKVYMQLYSRLLEVHNTQTRTGTLRALRTLVSHNIHKVIGTLLEEPLPLSDTMVEVWHVMGQDEQLATAVIDQLLDTLTRCLPYEELSPERNKEKPPRRATHTPLAALIGITELSKSEESCVPLMNAYPRLVAIILIQIASLTGCKCPKRPERKEDSKLKTMFSGGEERVGTGEVAVEALRQVIQCCHGDKLITALDKENVWSCFKSEERLADGFSIFTRCLVETQPEFISKMISHLNPVLSGLYYPQRAMAAAVFAELIAHQCAGDSVLLDMLVQSLLGRLVDPDRDVRRLCIRGLGNISQAGKNHVQKYCTTVLSAMMSGMDDKDDKDDVITLEAMTGLSKIISAVNESDIQPILINVVLRIRPCYENEKSSIRVASFTLFGELCVFGRGPSREPLLEQIHSHLVSLLLHLNDQETDVKQACKKALKQAGPLLDAEVVDNILQNHLNTGSLHYGEFINALTKAIINDLPDRLNHYVMSGVQFFKSSFCEMRCNAAIFVGFLLGNMPAERSVSISKEHVCSALASLMKDPESSVRISAASAVGLLYNL